MCVARTGSRGRVCLLPPSYTGGTTHTGNSVPRTCRAEVGDLIRGTGCGSGACFPELHVLLLLVFLCWWVPVEAAESPT